MAILAARDHCIPNFNVQVESSKTFYSGYSKSRNRFLFLISGKKFWGHGLLQQVVGHSRGKAVLLSIKKTRVDAPQAQASNYQGFFCASKDSLLRYRFTGTLEVCKEKQAPVKAVQGTAVKSSLIKQAASLQESNPQVETSRTAHPKDRLTLRYQQELARVRMAQAAGLDPDVRMTFIVSYVGESRASLYAKMKATPQKFPSRIKRGHGSFWPLSVIDAYRRGEWVPQVVQGNPAGPA
ncbi:hypothetical protein N5C43_04070 [Comamonas terrigena]|jgi:predicted DNA-binding transcriptional regulator AlpA|uniref:helix-turn-helix transcriptional regulator n=1 Tax=Comamonas terrigena TaxID=32013 RepID=UPI0024489929|nr:hypothetical protein [Comamonas terrigena]MDH1290431.1 hypothetical protein [Comamonas terrigena]